VIPLTVLFDAASRRHSDVVVLTSFSVLPVYSAC